MRKTALALRQLLRSVHMEKSYLGKAGYPACIIQSTLMADFSFGFTEGSFLLLNGQKHLRSVAEDLISNKQKRTKRIHLKTAKARTL